MSEKKEDSQSKNEPNSETHENKEESKITETKVPELIPDEYVCYNKKPIEKVNWVKKKKTHG